MCRLSGGGSGPAAEAPDGRTITGSGSALQPPFSRLEPVTVNQPPHVGAKDFGYLGPLGRVELKIHVASVVNQGMGDKVVDAEEVADLHLNRRRITL